jgi:hypothetical protein
MINEAHQGLYDYSIEVIRSLILLNGGAIIAILTFAGHLVASDSSATSAFGMTLAKLLLWPMALFVLWRCLRRRNCRIILYVSMPLSALA